MECHKHSRWISNLLQVRGWWDDLGKCNMASSSYSNRCNQMPARSNMSDYNANLKWKYYCHTIKNLNKKVKVNLIQGRAMRWHEGEIQLWSLIQRGSRSPWFPRFWQQRLKGLSSVCFRWCCISTGAPQIQTEMATLIVFLPLTTFRFSTSSHLWSLKA